MDEPIDRSGLWRHGLTSNAIAVGCSGGPLQSSHVAIHSSLMFAGIRMGCYPSVRDFLTSLSFANGETAGTPKKTVNTMMIAGFISGAAGYFACTPFYQIKTQMQAEAGLISRAGTFLTGQRAGHPPSYRGTFSAFATIARQGGVRALWRGCTTLVVRGSLLTAGQQTGYDLTKTYFKLQGLTDGPALHVAVTNLTIFLVLTSCT